MVAYGMLISYYQRGWEQLPDFSPEKQKLSTQVSVIIALRNEEKNIEGLLQSLNGQDYPHHLFEVILVDDHSTDNTWARIQESFFSDHSTGNAGTPPQQMQAGGVTVSPIKMEGSTTGKKQAIETGIRAARGALIVTTDADCRFPSPWLRTLVAFYEEKNAKFIAAPVYMKHTKGLLSLFQSLDFITLQGITAASVHRRFHSMCNGANLAYERSAFFEVNGFAGIDAIPTGDDMLLMHKIYTRYPDQVFYLKSNNAIVETEPAASWSAFFHQRIRWASKADKYQDKRITSVLVLVYVLNLCFLALGIASFWKSTWLFFFGVFLLAKILIEFPFVQSVARFFGQQRLMWYFPLLQPLHILYTIIAGWLGRFGSYKWKGRRMER
jgi:cellulose synthase/poly-beta-1,6-N-acetylglucosamine synthase-like glycosyltransferase